MFISINLPEELNEYLAGLQDGLAEVAGGGVGSRGAGGCGVDLVLAGRKSGFHLTLVFLGEVGMDVVVKLQEELKRIEFVPFELELAGELGVFKDRRGFAKVVFVSVDERSSGYGALLDLQKRVSEVVRRFGDLGESSKLDKPGKPDKPFASHVTLARVKWSPVGFADAVRELRVGSVTEKKKFVVDAFYLMESELGSGGSRYEKVGRFAAGA